MAEEPEVDIGQIIKESQETAEENQYLKSKSLGLQDAVDGGYLPKPDPNLIEYKLSPEELLAKIEHYLKGDILKTRENEDNQIESFYSSPTINVSVLVIQEKKSQIVYYIQEIKKQTTGEFIWKVVSVLNPGEKEEEIMEKEEGFTVGEQLKNDFNNVKYIKLGYSKREVIDKARVNLSDYGVSEVMNILSMYITKETFLSFYKEDRIYEIMSDIGHELNKFFYINGHLMGLDTEYKKTKYPIMVVTILHSIENAYRRSIMGAENRGTREGIVITQHQPMGNQMGMNPSSSPRKKWNPFDKTTW